MADDRSTLVLLTGEAVPLAKGEFLRVARHRFMLGFYLCIAVFVLFANLRGGAAGVASPAAFSIHFLSVGAGVAFLVAYARAGAMLARRAGRPHRLNLPVAMTLVITVSMGLGDWLELWLLAKPLGTAAAVLARWGFYVVTVQIVTALAMHFLLPRILAELRGQPAAATATVGLEALAAPPPPAEIRLGGQSVDPAALLHLRADGNRVIAVLRDGTLALPGPLTEVLSHLPAGLGHLVHRSHWIAAGAVAHYRRSGRQMDIHLANGTAVRVAETRLAGTLAWLESIGAPQGERPGRSAVLP